MTLQLFQKLVNLTEICTCVNEFVKLYVFLHVFAFFLTASEGKIVADATKYVIFNTKWGYFGLAANKTGLLRTHLPLPTAGQVKTGLLKELPEPRYDRDLLRPLQQQIIAYFAGKAVDFSSDIPLRLDGLSGFTKRVLTACRKIRPGQTLTYSQLAERIGRPRAARAIGAALAKNPIPLIIPCHRVIRSDGTAGGFTAPSGIKLKRKLLNLEKHPPGSR